MNFSTTILEFNEEDEEAILHINYPDNKFPSSKIHLNKLPGTPYFFTNTKKIIGESIDEHSVWNNNGDYVGKIWPFGHILPNSVHVESSKEEELIELRNALRNATQKLAEQIAENLQNMETINNLDREIITNQTNNSSCIILMIAFIITCIAMLIGWINKN